MSQVNPLASGNTEAVCGIPVAAFRIIAPWRLSVEQSAWLGRIFLGEAWRRP